MTARRPYVRVEGNNTYVIGTDQCQEAIRILGITPETHQWVGTDYGLFIRRRGQWWRTWHASPPKDAKPGVCFYGPIRAKGEVQ